MNHGLANQSSRAFSWNPVPVSSDTILEVSAVAVNITIPEALRWSDTRRGEGLMLTTLNVRLLPDGHLAAKAYGRPVGASAGEAGSGRAAASHVARAQPGASGDVLQATAA